MAVHRWRRSAVPLADGRAQTRCTSTDRARAAAPRSPPCAPRNPSSQQAPALNIHDGLELAAVVGPADRRPVRHLPRRIRLRRRISTGSIPTLAAARSIMRSTTSVAFRPAGAAVGGERAGVGEDAVDRDDVHRREGVHARQHARADQRRVRGRGPSWQPKVVVGCSRAWPARCRRSRQCHRRRPPGRAAVEVGQESFAAVAHHLHGAADALRRPQHQDFLGIEPPFAEAAADVAGDDVDTCAPARGRLTRPDAVGCGGVEVVRFQRCSPS